jgi:Spy/CpxP family protein refolding chaperone
MTRFRIAALAVGLFLVGGPWVAGQDSKKETKDPAPKARGTLPQNWGKLGLTDEQKSKIYEAQGKYRAKIDALKKQMAELTDQEKKEMEAVLTDAQKARLREIIGGKAPADTKTESKSDSKKDKP